MSAAVIDIADPAVRLYERWRRLWDATEGAEDDAELDALSERYNTIEEELVATPASSVAGALCKLKCMFAQGCEITPDEDLIVSAIADLERLAQEPGGAP